MKPLGDDDRKQYTTYFTLPNFLEFPTDIVLLVVLWRVRYKLSLRDLAEMFLHRGFEFTHEAVREWEARFAPLMANKLRAKCKGQADGSWHTDETYIKVGGVWKYLYRAIDRNGNLVDSMLSDHPAILIMAEVVGTVDGFSAISCA